MTVEDEEIDPSRQREENRPSCRCCRIVVLGSTRARIAKVASSLLATTEHVVVGGVEEGDSSNNHGNVVVDDDFRVRVEYLPCVPTFGDYRDEYTGRGVRYLARVDYFPLEKIGASQSKSGGAESLLPFFDGTAPGEEEDGECNGDGILFPPIAGVAVGCGLESDSDGVTNVVNFLKTSMGRATIPVQCVAPQPEFETMDGEYAAYRTLDADGKAEASRLETMGPGKMAAFSRNFARRIVTDAIEEERRRRQQQEEELLRRKEVETAAAAVVEEPSTSVTREPDPTKTRYCCRKCRTMLFGDDDLEDPPHAPSEHDFSRRKRGSGAGTSNGTCQSYFLKAGLEGYGWLDTGSASGAAEGRLACPRCYAKVGTYHWHGAQCSCGTWVVPALQVPRSRVDPVPPVSSSSSSLSPPTGEVGGSGDGDDMIQRVLPPGAVVWRPVVASSSSSYQQPLRR